MTGNPDRPVTTDDVVLEARASPTLSVRRGLRDLFTRDRKAVHAVDDSPADAAPARVTAPGRRVGVRASPRSRD